MSDLDNVAMSNSPPKRPYRLYVDGRLSDLLPYDASREDQDAVIRSMRDEAARAKQAARWMVGEAYDHAWGRESTPDMRESFCEMYEDIIPITGELLSKDDLLRGKGRFEWED